MLGDCTEEVKVELDKLNLASSSINQLENQLEECRRQFQLALSEGSKQLSATYRKLKSSIEKSRPYSEVFYRRQQLILDIQRNSEQYGVAQAEFEAAQSVLDNYSSAAKFQHTDLSQLDDVNRAIDKVFHCCHIIRMWFLGNLYLCIILLFILYGYMFEFLLSRNRSLSWLSLCSIFTLTTFCSRPVG
uniref:SH3 domain-binding protein 5 homolog n=1 Tax=Schistocephalus solidus TaxID=70667 RepID=A0A0V0JBY7_SCHSO